MTDVQVFCCNVSLFQLQTYEESSSHERPTTGRSMCYYIYFRNCGKLNWILMILTVTRWLTQYFTVTGCA